MKKYTISIASDFSGHLCVYVRWDWLDKALEGKEHEMPAIKLRKLLELGCQAEGDAMGTLLMVEAVLRDKDYSAMMFYKLYQDVPSKIKSVTVQYKHRFVTNWDETELE